MINTKIMLWICKSVFIVADNPDFCPWLQSGANGDHHHDFNSDKRSNSITTPGPPGTEIITPTPEPSAPPIVPTAIIKIFSHSPYLAIRLNWSRYFARGRPGRSAIE